MRRKSRRIVAAEDLSSSERWFNFRTTYLPALSTFVNYNSRCREFHTRYAAGNQKKRSPKTRPSRLYRNGCNLSLYRSCSVVRGTPCTTDFPSFLPRSPPPPFFISPSWHWKTRVAAGSNRRNDSGLRRGKKKKKNKARNRGRFEIIYSFFLFFSTPSLSFLLHDSQAWRWFCISLSLPNSFLLFLCLLFSYDDDRFRRCFLNWKHDWKTKSKRGPNVYSERTEKENFAEMKAAINRRSLLFFPPFFLFFF